MNVGSARFRGWFTGAAALACAADPATDDEPVVTATAATLPGTTDGSEGDGSSASTDAPTSSSADESATTAGTTSSDDTSESGLDDTGETGVPPTGPGCAADWPTAHPEWIFCDDFESADPLLGEGRYFEYDDNDGDFVVVDGVGTDGSRGMQVVWQTGEVGAGAIHVAFGRVPDAYFDTGIRSGEDFREIYYRMMLRNDDGWTGSPAKLSRATVFSGGDWSQAMIAHAWSDDAEHLIVDPASCVVDGQVTCVGYNDFDNLQWLGLQAGATSLFATAEAGEWRCIEVHVRLDDPGQGNGVHEFWIDGELDAQREGLTFVGDYAEYGLNAVFFENYWNDGSVQDQRRFFDDIVISTQPIGCP